MDGELIRDPEIDGMGTIKQFHLGDAGQGVNRKRVHLRNTGVGVNRKLVHLGDAGQGVNRQPKLQMHTSTTGAIGLRERGGIYSWFADLAERLRQVRVCCGDWTRVCGPTPTVCHGLTAVFFDPPYSAEAGRDNKIYEKESLTVAHDVRAWCLEHGDDKLMRIAICGYDVEHRELEAHGWDCVAWKAQGGYASQGDGSNENCRRERIWYSPHCRREATLFDGMTDS